MEYYDKLHHCSPLNETRGADNFNMPLKLCLLMQVQQFNVTARFKKRNGNLDS